MTQQETGVRERLLSSIRERLADLGDKTRPVEQQSFTAFVLSGGGNLGAVQVGMLRALVERDIQPDLIVGCSVGAINGAAFAAEPGIRGVHRLERIWSRIADGDPDIMPNRGLLPMAVQMARKGSSIHTQDALEQLLHDELIAQTFDELALPFACVAANVDTAGEEWFDTGELVPRVLASAALPGVFPPVDIDGARYFDGGVVNEVPLRRAVELGATTIYLLHVGHLDDRSMESASRPFDVLAHAYWSLRANRLDDELEQLPDHIALVDLDAGPVPRLRFDDYSQGRDLIDSAYRSVSKQLNDRKSENENESENDREGASADSFPE